MTSQVPHPAKEELHLHQTQNAGTIDESSIQNADRNLVLEPSPGNADTEIDQTEEGTSKEAVAEDGNDEAQRRREDHGILVQKLNYRLSGLEQRLQEASLLEKPEDQSDPNSFPENKAEQTDSKLSATVDPVSLGISPKLPSSSDEIGHKENFGQIQDTSDNPNGRGKSIEVLADRIDSLETRLQEAVQLMDQSALGNKRAWSSAGYELEGEEKNHRTVPQLHYVQWSDFKNKLWKAEITDMKKKGKPSSVWKTTAMTATSQPVKIILLHGAPGVGKTSTAETVAESFGKLLFPITCGDLGLTADRVELELSEKVHLAELWDCVLLLDEADVFLARRTNTDIKRNSLVSVFLRVLERFTGVLFLTTNRVGAFDEAFKSQIHISLYYSPLDAEKTHDIWKMNLERLSKKKHRRNEPMDFNETEILRYARRHYNKTSPQKAIWNGRQIRNAFQTASALAKFEAHEQNRKAKGRSEETGNDFEPIDPQLEVKHFKKIASASYEFDKYISETRGATDTELAFRDSQRMDEYQPSRRDHRDREQQPIQIMDIPALKAVPAYALGPNAQLRAPRALQTSSRGIRPVYVGSPTQDISDQDSLYYRRSARRGTKSVNTYGASTSAVNSTIEHSSAARSRSRAAQQPGCSIAHNRERQRHEVFDQRKPLYEDGFEEEPLYQESHEEYFYQPTSNYEDTNQRGESPRRRQGGNFQATNRNPTVIGYDGTLEDEEDTFSG